MAAKITIQTSFLIKRMLVSFVLLLLPVSFCQAMTVYEDVSFITGVDGVSGTNNSFTVSQTGSYQASLVDFVFPTEFDSLGLTIIEGESFETTVSHFSTDGGFNVTFDANPGLYYVNVLGDAGGDLNIGLYGLKITQLSTVPLPPAILLFLSSMGVLIYVAWRKTKPENKDLFMPVNGISWNTA
jgi:hypothetical protein